MTATDWPVPISADYAVNTVADCLLADAEDTGVTPTRELVADYIAEKAANPRRSCLRECAKVADPAQVWARVSAELAAQPQIDALLAEGCTVSTSWRDGIFHVEGW